MSISEEQLAAVYKLASVKTRTGQWMYGRDRIKREIPEISVWQIRKILEEVRGVNISASSIMTESAGDCVPKTSGDMKIVVKLPKLPESTKRTKRDSIERWVIASDFHAPYQHEPSCSIFYQVLQDLQPDKVILLGDVVNLNTFSRYDKDPTGPTWLEDVASAGAILGNVKLASPDSKLEWRKGNHEDRLKKHLIRHDPILYPYLTIQNLFVLSNNDKAVDSIGFFEFIDKNEEIIDDLNLILKHGDTVRKHSGRSAGSEVENLWMSVVMGHCHRQGIVMKASGRSRYKDEYPAFGMEVGCMCKFDLDYIAGATPDWQHGFGVLTIDRSDAVPVVEPSVIQIKNKKALFAGKVYRA